MRERGPQAIGNVLSELMARRGFARVQSAAAYEAAWQQAVGPFAAKYSRPGKLSRGKLEIAVANSTLIQELVFRKQELIETLAGLLPDERIRDLRFRVGRME